MLKKVQLSSGEKTLALRAKGDTPAASELREADIAVEYETVSQRCVRLRIDGKWTTAYVAKGDDGLWVFNEGRVRRVAMQDERANRRSARERDNRHITPPMPSTVVRVLVAVGQRVEADAALVVVSAMKMEATLRAPYAGTVSAIRAEVGATVRPGDVLVEVAPQE